MSTDRDDHGANPASRGRGDPIEPGSRVDVDRSRVGPRFAIALGMHTTSLDNIVSRQRGRTLRDRMFVIAIAFIVVFGIGAVVTSAQGATATAPRMQLVR